MNDINLLKAKKTKLSRIYLKPLIGSPSLEMLNSMSPRYREALFFSPKPSKSGLLSGCSSPKSILGAQAPLEASKSERFPQRPAATKRKTPPDIRKIEKDWKKISTNENRAVEVPQGLPVSSRRPNRIATEISKGKNVGIPARFRAVELSKSVSRKSELKNYFKCHPDDLELLKSNSKDEISKRVQFNKFQEKYLNLKLRENHVNSSEDSWKWTTPNDSNSEQSSFTEKDRDI